MAKKKKGGNNRKDARGYGQTSTSIPQPTSQAPPPKPAAGRAQPKPPPQGRGQKNVATAPPAKNKVVQVSTKTHESLLQLLLKLTEQENLGNPHQSSRIVPAAAAQPRILDSKVAKVVERLEELKFTLPQIEQVATALGYGFTTIETTLDWLCFHLPSSELPSLFTEQQVRDDLQRQQQDDDQFTVFKFSSPATADGASSTPHESPDVLFPVGVSSSGIGKQPTEKLEQQQKDDEDAEARKAWLLSQYAYEDSEDEEETSINEKSAGVTLDSTNPPQDSENRGTTKPEESVGSPPSMSPQEIQLSQLEEELKVAREELNNEANNYMRSKQETKELASQVKKLQQQVSGLRKNVEKQRAKQQAIPAKSTDEDAPPLNDNIFQNEIEEDDDNNDGYGADLFSSFGGASSQEAVEPVQGDVASSNSSSKQDLTIVDYSIPGGWTGTTPQKTLNEYYQHKKRKGLAKPKYFKLPGNRGNKKDCGYRLVISTEKGEKIEFQQDKGVHVNFLGDVQEYLAIQALYALEPMQPLYQRFPPAFRDLWLSWLHVVEQEVIQQRQDIETVRVKKVERILSLINESSTSALASEAETPKDTSPLKQNVSPSIAPQTQGDAGTGRLPDSWEDSDSWEDYGNEPDDTDALPTVDTNQPNTSPKTEIRSSKLSYSAKGAQLRDEFVQRQSTKPYQQMLQLRKALPMFSFRETLLNTIRDNPVTILCAETGAGKSTQCCQYLIEEALLEGFGESIQIICTQPRRVAAISVAERVAEELCDPRGIGATVGYQIRMEARKSSSTRVLFCTTGIILRRLQDDPTLAGVTHVLVDEVHERQQQTDVCLIALRRMLNTTRPDLKVVLMSATLDSQLFCSFFNGAPLVSVPGRTFAVSSYYLEDLMDATDHIIEEGSRYAVRDDIYGGSKATLWVTNRGGEKRKEVVDLVSQVDVSEVSDLYPGYKMSTRRSMDRVNEEVTNYDLLEEVLTLLLVQPEHNSTLLAPEGADLSTGSVLVFLPGLGEIRSVTERLEANRALGNKNRFQIIPMHSTLSSRDQRKAFVPARQGCRKIILSTNICETSVTVPDVVCVIDSGRVREVRQNKRTSTSTLVADWCSKASAKQRAGRAGRVQPGICLKLYSSRTANVTMKAASEPELRRVPLEEVCLSILASGFATSVDGGCLGFLKQAPEPPAEMSVQSALNVLLEVGAISLPESSSGKTSAKGVECLTPLGRHLAKLPVDVRLGKMLIFGSLFGCLDKSLTVAACLSSESIFSTFLGADAAVAQAKQRSFFDSESDFLTLCNVYEGFREAGDDGGRKFCRENFLNFNALREIRSARQQFFDLLCSIGFVDRVEILGEQDLADAYWKLDDNAMRGSIYNKNGSKAEVIHSVIAAGLYPNVANVVASSGASSSCELWHRQERLYFHSNSVNFKLTQKQTSAAAASILRQRHQSSWIAFHEKFGTSNRVSISTTCFVHPFALLLLGGSVEVKHVDRKVIVDEWIEVGLAAQTGVMIRELRHQVDRILDEMISLPSPSSKQNKSGSDSNLQPDQASNSSTDQNSIMVDGIVELLMQKR